MQYHRGSFAIVSLTGALACNFGLIHELEQAPVCSQDAGTEAACAALDSSGGEGTQSPLSTMPGADAGGMMTAEGTGGGGIETTTNEPGLPTDETTEGTSGPQPAGPPTIERVKLEPEALQQAGQVEVEVEAVNAVGVTMTVDAGEPVALVARGGNIYTGSIEVFGASMNGTHAVLITAESGEEISTRSAQFMVDAPPPGQNIWLKTNDVPHSQTRAIAVDKESNVYEVGTVGQGPSARMVVGKRDAQGEQAWPGMWLSLHDGEARGEDIAVGPDGQIYVLGNYQDKDDHTRWWLGKLDPTLGELVESPQLGEIDEPARGLSVAENGDLAIVGQATVWGKQNAPDVQTKVWVRPHAGAGVVVEWGYSPSMLANKFAEVPEDVLILDGRIFVTGSAEGIHLEPQDLKPRKRLFVVEFNFKGQAIREYVADAEPYVRSGGAALASDGKGGVVVVGWACHDDCTQVGDIQWLNGEGALTPYARQFEIGKSGPAFATDVGYHPAGYNVVVSTASMGQGPNLGLRVTGRRASDLTLVVDYAFDTAALEAGQAVAVGPHGYFWFAGLRTIDDVLRAVVGRAHG